jgi:hypothetical protein
MDNNKKGWPNQHGTKKIINVLEPHDQGKNFGLIKGYLMLIQESHN